MMYCTYIMYSGSTPLYVGAGRSSRPSVARRRLSSHQHLLAIVYEQSSKKTAHDEERRLIEVLGRADKNRGTLLNRTDGLGSRGREWTQSQRSRVAAAALGREKSEDERAKISRRMLGNQHLLGHIHSEETRRKIGEASRGRKLNLSDEERARRAAAIAERNRSKPPRAGRACSPEHREKLSLARKKR